MVLTNLGRFMRNVLLIGLLGLAAAGVAVRLRADEPPPSSRSSGVPADEIGHLHGIGLNPRDARLYVATHSGVLTITPDGEIERVADRYQDTMGFTVLGPDRFLASGHPDVRDDAPTSLGLLRSDDAAKTWKPISLYGEADLHTIVAAHDRVYAADATAGWLIVSFDEGRTWERRGPIELTALAVDPTNPDVLVGADYEGDVQRSNDGGRTWQSVDGPRVAALAWDRKVGLLAAGPDGDVFGSVDGTSWLGRGDLGGTGPVLTIAEGAAWAAIDGLRIVRSDDGGTTWTAQ